uniref:3-phosphoinositide-dependent protein kinase 1 n=1 Tax=Trichogramma kaykai TaxID=54128 RepID=A0ABD2X7L1_9HYME
MLNMSPPPQDVSDHNLELKSTEETIFPKTNVVKPSTIYPLLQNHEQKQNQSHSQNNSQEPIEGQNSNQVVRHKRSPKDFIFGKVIGEGSFSTVYLAKDIHTNKEYAIKVCEKRHIIKERKTQYVKREKEVLNMLANAKHYFVRLFCTFQDVERLYFVLSYAKNGELLPHITKNGSFDIECTKFYSAEILRGLEYLHGLGIIHRDLKPENILLDDKMHALITDFGSAKILGEPDQTDSSSQDHRETSTRTQRRNSFVGTAQYVSPELLSNKISSPASDLWAFGCIIYQMVAGLPPFRSRSEYQIFQKILQVDYEVPDGFCEVARNLVGLLLVREPSQRLGANDKQSIGYTSIRAHPFFNGIDFEKLPEQTPPPICPYLPGTSDNEEMRSQYRLPDNLEPGLDDKQLTRLLGLGIGELSEDDEDDETTSLQSSSKVQCEKLSTLQMCEQQKVKVNAEKSDKISESPQDKSLNLLMNDHEFICKLAEQKSSNQWHQFVQNNLILKEGFVNKRKGLFARRRMLLLTTGPHLYYVDPFSMTLKGEIPWSNKLKVEPKNFKIFFVHTPNRTYYLEDPQGFALDWCQTIDDVRIHYYGQSDNP